MVLTEAEFSSSLVSRWGGSIDEFAVIVLGHGRYLWLEELETGVQETTTNFSP